MPLLARGLRLELLHHDRLELTVASGCTCSQKSISAGCISLRAASVRLPDNDG
jgi:hypothetical protein